ncbi:MAG: hypothetical protein CSA66_04940 [Proteobacteria bacterium]|nr:MAG: hypothetical protein CSA66_04940 [Pseudomonadota bacterium]
MAQHELKMDKDKPLSVALGGAFKDMVDFARSRAERAGAAPEAAVHDFRRSIRRAGAQLKLTKPFLSDKGAAWMREALKKAFARTGALRDHGVLIPTLDKLEGRLSVKGAAERIRELLQADKATAEGLRAPELLGANIRFLTGLGEAYQAALEGEVSDGALRQALRASYAKARAAFRRTKQTRDEDDLHTWRKAVKALRYQLELVTSRGEGGLEAAHESFIAQAKRLGEITDLMALRDFVKDAEQALEGLEPKRLVKDIEAVIRPRINAALEAAKQTYEARVKRFGRSDAKAAAQEATQATAKAPPSAPEGPSEA